MALLRRYILVSNFMFLLAPHNFLIHFNEGLFLFMNFFLIGLKGNSQRNLSKKGVRFFVLNFVCLEIMIECF